MSPGMSFARRALTGAAWITLETTGLQLLSLLLFAFLARLLSPADFGLASVAFVLVSTCKIVLIDGIATIVSRKAAASEAEYATAFWITVAVTLLAFAGLQLFSLVADAVFRMPGLGPVSRIMAVMLLAQGVARTQEVWLMRHFHYRTLALRSLAGALVGGVAGVGCAWAGFGVAALAVQQVTASACAFALLWFNCPWRPRLMFSATAARETLSFFFSTSGSSLAYAFAYSFDTMLIGAFFGPANTGAYNVAKRLRYAVQAMAAAPVNGVAMPTLANLQDDADRFLPTLLTATTILLAVCAPAFLGAAALSRDLIVLVFGPQWAAAAPMFQWLAVGGLCAVLIDQNGNIFLIRGRPRWTLYLAALNVGLTFAAFFGLAASGTDQVAAPFVLPYLLVLPLSVAGVLRATGLPLRRWLGAASGPLVACAAMLAVLAVAAPWTQGRALGWRLAGLIALGAVTYTAVAALLLRRPLAELLRMRRAAA